MNLALYHYVHGTFNLMGWGLIFLIWLLLAGGIAVVRK